MVNQNVKAYPSETTTLSHLHTLK